MNEEDRARQERARRLVEETRPEVIEADADQVLIDTGSLEFLAGPPRPEPRVQVLHGPFEILSPAMCNRRPEEVERLYARPVAELEGSADWLWPNFSPAEVSDRDTGLVYVDPRLMDMLEGARRDLGGKPMRLSCAYRGPKYNARCGGVAKSQHLVGRGADVFVGNLDPVALEEALIRNGATGIKRYPGRGFIHADIGDNTYGGGRPWNAGPKFPKRATRFDPDEATRGNDSAPAMGAVAATVGTTAAVAGNAQATVSAFQGVGFWPIVVVVGVVAVGVVAWSKRGWLSYWRRRLLG